MSKIATKKTILFTIDRVSNYCSFYMSDQFQYDPLKRASVPQNSLPYFGKIVLYLHYIFANTYRNSLLDMWKKIHNVSKHNVNNNQCISFNS